ncbi:MAG TPA: hypothetical protein VK099_09545 [Alcanivoracaceae bacterium]|nr:hypothetical protein [Alcanivoracaceae bacterium]
MALISLSVVPVVYTYVAADKHTAVKVFTLFTLVTFPTPYHVVGSRPQV